MASINISTVKDLKEEITGSIIYNVDVVYSNNSLHSDYKCNYECMLMYDGIFIRNIGIKDSNYNNMITQCKGIITDYIKFNNPIDTMPIVNVYDHMLRYSTQARSIKV